MEQDFLKDKVLEIVGLSDDDSNNESVEYQYVTLKIKKIYKTQDDMVDLLKLENGVENSEYKILCQIVDVSHKMLYTDVKAE